MIATLDNYRYIFTGQIPAVYLTAGANRGMISDSARQVPAGIWHSTLVALGVMSTNIAFGAPAAYAFARCRFYGQTVSFLAIILSRLVPAVALVTPFYLIVQSVGLLGYQGRTGPGPLGPHSAVHSAHPDHLL